MRTVKTRQNRIYNLLIIVLFLILCTVFCVSFADTNYYAYADSATDWEIKLVVGGTELSNISFEDYAGYLDYDEYGAENPLLRIDVLFYPPASMTSSTGFQALLDFSDLLPYLNDEYGLDTMISMSVPTRKAGLKNYPIWGGNSGLALQTALVENGMCGIACEQNVDATFDSTAGPGVVDFGTSHLALSLALLLKTNSDGSVILPTELLNLQVLFDIPTGITWPGSTTELWDGDGNLFYRNGGMSGSYGTISSIPFQIGEASAEPSAELSDFSLMSGTTNFISSYDETNGFTFSGDITYAQANAGLTLGYTKASSSATVGVTFSNGSSATYDPTTGLISGLRHGESIILSVSDSDGALTKTYTISPTIAEPSSDATLKSLASNQGILSPEFSANTYNYTLSVPYAVTELTLSAAANDANAQVTIDNIIAPSKKISNLEVGTVTKNIVVLAEDGRTTQTYGIQITRQPASQNVALGSLSVSGTPLTIVENQEIYNHKITESSASFSFAAAGAEPAVQLLKYSYDNGGTWVTSVNTVSVNKNESKSVLIRVFAEDRTVWKDYTLNVTRAASTVTALESVKVTEDNTTVTLTPSGSVYTYNYNNSAVPSITVAALGKTGENATVVLLKGDSSSSTIVENGVIPVDTLTIGDNIYTIKVTPQDTTAPVAYYTVKIVKKSSENAITSIIAKHTDNGDAEITGWSLSEADNKYTLTIPYAWNGTVVNNISIVITSSPYSSINGTGWTAGTTTNNSPSAYISVSFAGVNQNTVTKTVTVTAQNGSERTYSILIVRSAADGDATLKDIIVGSSSLANFGSGTLNYPTPTIFAADETSVNVFGEVNSALSSVEYFYTVEGGTRQKSENGQIPFTRGKQIKVELVVTAQSEVTKTYTLYVIAANTDNSISNITMQKTDGSSISGLNFNPSATEPFAVSVAYAIDTIKFVITTPENAGSTIYVNNSTAGDGTYTSSLTANNVKAFKIYAVSEAGVKGTEYTINVTRNAARTDNTLASLIVSSANVTNYITNFVSSTDAYYIRVDNNVTWLRVRATLPSDNGSRIISGTTESLTWAGSSTTATVIVEAENGDRKEYKIYITRANDENDITDIDVSLQEITFAPATLAYPLSNVANSVSSLTFTVALKDSSAKIYSVLNGAAAVAQGTTFTLNLREGANSIQIYALSEYGALTGAAPAAGETYTFTVTRNAKDTNNLLSSLKAIGSDSTDYLENVFQSSVATYTLRVDRSVSTISFEAVAAGVNAQVSGIVTDATLTAGTVNTFSITVTSESNSSKTYNVKIYRADNVKTISGVSVTGQSFAFSEGTVEYNLNAVAYANSKAKFKVTLANAYAALYASVNGAAFVKISTPANFELDLAEGENVISIYALSEYEELTGASAQNVYEFNLERSAADSTTTLSSLTVTDENGNNHLAVFSETQYSYTIRVDRSVDMVNIAAVAKGVNATVSGGIGSKSLALGSNSYTITVTSESGAKRDYTLAIKRANDIKNIENITVDGHTEFTYAPVQLSYALSDVAYGVKKLSFSVTLPSDSYAKLYMSFNNGAAAEITNPSAFDVTLSDSKSADKTDSIKLYAVSDAGNKGDEYVFTVKHLKASNDTTLSSLTVKKNASSENYITSFDPEETIYEIRVDNAVSSVYVTASATNPGAVVAITPTSPAGLTDNSKNTVYVKVTAEDGTSERTYYVYVYRASNNNGITQITVDGVAITLNPSAPVVLDALPFSKKSITIAAVKEDATSTVYGVGTMTLADGENVFEVYAISQYGILKGETKSDVAVYTIKVNRTAANTDKTLEGLSVLDGEGGNAVPFDSGVSFSPSVYAYVITLPNDSALTSLYFDAIASTNSKTLSGHTGLQNLVISSSGTINQKFSITVKAENGDTQVYEITVLKGTSLSGDNSIRSVTLTDADNQSYLSFSDTTFDYGTISIPFAKEYLRLTVTPTDANAVVSGNTGYIAVPAGGSVNVSFKVVAQDGSEGSAYTFTISRAAAKTDKYLDSLTIEDSSNPGANLFVDKNGNTIFNPSQLTYSLRVDDSVTAINFNATVPAGNGSVILTQTSGTYTLASGQSKEISIIVKAENGDTQTYTVTVKRANNDAEIESISIDGRLVPIADFVTVGSNKEYIVSPDYIHSTATAEIAVNMKNSDSKATVYGAGIKTLADGSNAFTVYAVAQDGETQSANYIIRITRSAASGDATLKSLEITNGADILLDAPSSVNDTYSLSVTRAVTSVDISAIAKHAGAIVTGDVGECDLTAGAENTLKIFVTAENGSNKTYTVKITVKDSDASVNAIKSAFDDGSLNNITFVEHSGNYGFTFAEPVAFNVMQIKIAATLANAYAKLYINGAEYAATATQAFDLSDGENTFVVYALAEDGTKGAEYTIKVTRTAADGNTALSALAVKDSESSADTLAFNEGAFDPTVYDYTIVLPSNSKLTSIFIFAAAASEYSVVSGAGIQALTETAGIIHNTFNITVSAQNGDTAQYSVTVIRSDNSEQSDDCEVKSVSLKGNNTEYFKNFDADKVVQSPITVPYGVSAVYLAVGTHAKASAAGVGPYTIDAGATVTIKFRVTAEDGSVGTEYSVDVTREAADTNNVLTSLYYEADTVRYTLDLTKGTVFNVNLASTLANVTVGGAAPEKASVSGFETVDLDSSVITHIVTVTSESGAVKSYVINFSKKSDDSTLKSIKINGVERFGEFTSANNNTYIVSVPYSTKEATIAAAANNGAATVVGNGTFVLSNGENVYEIYAISEAGNKGETYTVKITQEQADNDATLKSLIVRNNANDEIKLQKSSADGVIALKNTLDLTNFSDINEIKIEAEATGENAVVEGAGIKTLQTAAGASTQIFKVKVTAEDGTSLTYEITVIRNVLPENDTTIDGLSLIGSDAVNYLGTAEDAVNAFVLSNKSYTLTVPYATNNVTLSISNNNGAVVMIKLNGVQTNKNNFVLSNTGDTVISFYLTSASGNFTSDTYTVTVKKEAPSSDATLKNLTVDGYTIAAFSPSKFSYDMTVSLEDVTSVVIGAEANDSRAAVSGTGSVTLQAGSNTVSVTVTAEDGTAQTYTVKINRLGTDNKLKSLAVENCEITPVFAEATTVYNLTVPYSVSVINIIAQANSVRATLSGAGAKSLAEGLNVFYVYAISEQGVNGTFYTVNVTRTPVSTDSALKSLKLYTYDSSSGSFILFNDLNPTFDPATFSYSAIVGGGIGTIKIEAEPNSINASVSGVGQKALKAETNGNYNNVYDILVTAQDGVTTSVYTVYIYREGVVLDDLADVRDLQVRGSDGVLYLGLEGAQTSFSAATRSYTITVPFTVESATFNISGLSATAQANGNGNVSFGTSNTITKQLYIISQNGANTSATYTVVLNRETADGENTLEYIKIDGRTISGFDPDITNYSLTLPYTGAEKSVIVDAAATGSGTIISGTGVHNLNSGNNTVTITVQSEGGEIRNYTVLIEYFNDNALLSSLNVLTCTSTVFDKDNATPYTMTFDPKTNSYNVVIDKSVKSLNINGEAEDQTGAAVIGFGEYRMDSDSKTVVINVLSADRSTTTSYTLNITRTTIPSGESRLESLTIGGHSLAFNSDVYYYTLAVGNSVKDLNLSAIAKDVNATVTVYGNEDFSEGKNAILIYVKAENGNTSVYQLVISRAEQPDYLLMILLIVVFVLWMITITVFAAKAYKNNKNKEKVQEVRIKD